MTMLEKVATALGNVELFDYRLTEEEAKKLAKAAIEALRVPTVLMIIAAWYDGESSPNGVLVQEASVGYPNTDHMAKDLAYEVWQAMIDAALNEGLNHRGQDR